MELEGLKKLADDFKGKGDFVATTYNKALLHFPAFVELLEAASNLVILRKLPHDLFCDNQKTIPEGVMKCNCGIDELIEAINKIETI